MRQQRNQDSSSIYRPKDSPTKTSDGSTTSTPTTTNTQQQPHQQHVQFANPECVTTAFKSSPIHRNLSSPSALHSPKSISQSAQPPNGQHSSIKSDGSATNGLKRASSNQSYHTTSVDPAAQTSSYENMPKTTDFTSSTKDYGGYVKPNSPLKSAGSLDKNIVPIVLSPTANNLKSKSITTTTKVTR